MAKLGTKKRPIIVRVNSDKTAVYVSQTCEEHGWKYIMSFEPDKPEDIKDLEKMLNPPIILRSDKIGRNDPCSCGSEMKYKKCCGATKLPMKS